MYTDLGSMFTSYPPVPAARGLLPCMQPAAGPGGYAPQTQIFGTQEGENKPPCAITFHGKPLHKFYKIWSLLNFVNSRLSFILMMIRYPQNINIIGGIIAISWQISDARTDDISCL